MQYNSIHVFASAYNNRASSYYHLGNLQATIRDCSQTISIDPRYHTAYMNRGVVLYHSKKYAMAQEDFQQFLDMNPKSEEAIREAKVYIASCQKFLRDK